MCRTIFILAIAFLLFSCNQNQPPAKQSLADSVHTADTSAIKAISPAHLIIPGKKIGHVYIHADADSLAAKLGHPSFTDAAMGALMMQWTAHANGQVYETTTYSHRNMGNDDNSVSYIKEIRTTHPKFKTAGYVGVGSELKDVVKLYKLIKRGVPGSTDKKASLYEDYTAGIGFEVDPNGKCTAILVHAPGDSSVTYINMHIQQKKAPSHKR
jgi:hypothetical protein